MDEALRIARKYAADVRDTGKVEVCKNGISRIVFEVCETQLDEDGDIVDEDTIEIVDPLEEPDRRLPGLDVVFHPQVDTHKKPPISRVQEMGGSSIWLPAAFYDFDLRTADQLKEVLEEVRSEWWQDWQTADEFDQIIYKLFAAES